ncbi:MAG: carboxypeptidase regulatory-like domain-containing protein, partial [Acidobacteria bacterium]|nr:carboxypeptidase regulatory-like domain-containing protein [Acidobacteriota bacterium]
MGKAYRVCFLLATLAIVPAIGAFAQSFTATMSGNVKDQTGAVLPGVEVTAANPATGLTRPVVTNERGDFVIPLLPVGTY